MEDEVPAVGSELEPDESAEGRGSRWGARGQSSGVLEEEAPLWNVNTGGRRGGGEAQITAVRLRFTCGGKAAKACAAFPGRLENYTGSCSNDFVLFSQRKNEKGPEVVGNFPCDQRLFSQHTAERAYNCPSPLPYFSFSLVITKNAATSGVVPFIFQKNVCIKIV